jgi:hypothetical protein
MRRGQGQTPLLPRKTVACYMQHVKAPMLHRIVLRTAASYHAERCPRMHTTRDPEITAPPRFPNHTRAQAGGNKARHSRLNKTLGDSSGLVAEDIAIVATMAGIGVSSEAFAVAASNVHT